MASLSIAKRTKEMAVRKVLGATTANLLVMLSRTYVRLIIIGCIFAFPVAYYLMSQWLKEFSKQIDVSWWMIILPGVIPLIPSTPRRAFASSRSKRALAARPPSVRQWT
jgi:putative ABC transport system permease protein